MFDKAKAERRRVNRAIKKLNTKPVPNEPSNEHICTGGNWDNKKKRFVCEHERISAIGDELDALINDVAPVHLQDKMKALIEEQTKLAREETAKAYGGCTSCYGKGYATYDGMYSGGGMKWPDKKMIYCNCSRGEQLRAAIEAQ